MPDLFLSWATAVPSSILLEQYLKLRALIRLKSRNELIPILETAENNLAALLAPYYQSMAATEERSYPLLASKEIRELESHLDKDIQRYVLCRKNKEHKKAQEVFTKLKLRYPDQNLRQDLIRFFRKKSPLFVFLYWEAKRGIGKSLWEKIRLTLDHLHRIYIAMESKPTQLVQYLKQALRVFPKDKAQAIPLIHHLQWASVLMEYHMSSLKGIGTLLLEYYGENSQDLMEIPLALPQKGQKKNKTKPSLSIDFSKAEFNQKDLEEILINPGVQGAENQTLLYCQKYWLKVDDFDFETKVHLYSQSKKTEHAQIFDTIAEGRRKAFGDDEILFGVYNILSKDEGYRYNVRRDIYMQKIWAKIKPKGKVSLRGDMDPKAYAEIQIKKAKEEKVRRSERAKEAQAIRRKQAQRKMEEAAIRAQIQKSRKAEIQKRAQQKSEAMVEKLHSIKERARQTNFETLEASKTLVQSIQKKDTPGSKPVKAPEPIGPRVLHSTQNHSSEWESFEGQPGGNSYLKETQLILLRKNLDSIIEDFLYSHIHEKEQALKSYEFSVATVTIKNFVISAYETGNKSWSMSNHRQELGKMGLSIDSLEQVFLRCDEKMQEELLVRG